MLQPLTSKDFGIRCLGDRIYDLSNLSYLYPDIPKDHVFSKYCTPFTGKNNFFILKLPVLSLISNDLFLFQTGSQTTTTRYVKVALATQLKGWNNNVIGNHTPSYPTIVGNGQDMSNDGSYPSTPSSVYQNHHLDGSTIQDTPPVASGPMSWLQ